MVDLNEKVIILLNKLEQSEDYVTTGEVADILGVSTRSVVRYLRIINFMDEDESFKIIAIPNRGLKLQILNGEGFEKFRKNILTLHSVRMEYSDLLLTILFKGPLPVSVLLSDFSYSESAMTRIITQLNRKLENRGLKIQRRNNQISFEGNEIKIRNLMQQLTTDKSVEELPLSANQRNMYKLLQSSIGPVADEENSQDFLMFIFIQLVRCINHAFVTFNHLLHFLLCEKIAVHQQTERIRQVFLGQFNLVIPEDEELFLNLFYLNQDEEQVPFNEILESMYPLIDNALASLDQEYKTTFRSDDQLKYGLVTHISSSLVKYLLLNPSDNKILDQIRLNYTSAFVYSQAFIAVLHQEIGLEIDEYDLGYITIHFATSLERHSGKSRHQAYVLYKHNLNTAQLLKARIENRFTEIDIVGILNVSEDPIPIESLLFTCDPEVGIEYDAIRVTPFVSSEDAQEVYRRLSDSNGFFPLLRMCFSDNYYLLNHMADKNQVLELLGEDLVRKGYLNEDERQNLFERETLSSTEIALNIAFPHTLIEGKSFLTVAILKQPILWKNNVVQLVLLMGLNQEDAQSKEAIRYLFESIRNIDKVNALIRSKSFDEFIDVLRR